MQDTIIRPKGRDEFYKDFDYIGSADEVDPKADYFKPKIAIAWLIGV